MTLTSRFICGFATPFHSGTGNPFVRAHRTAMACRARWNASSAFTFLRFPFPARPPAWPCLSLVSVILPALCRQTVFPFSGLVERVKRVDNRGAVLFAPDLRDISIFSSCLHDEIAVFVYLAGLPLRHGLHVAFRIAAIKDAFLLIVVLMLLCLSLPDPDLCCLIYCSQYATSPRRIPLRSPGQTCQSSRLRQCPLA